MRCVPHQTEPSQIFALRRAQDQDMNRRELLAMLAAGSFCPVRWWATPQTITDGRLVVLMLRGAYDGLSAVVPYADP